MSLHKYLHIVRVILAVALVSSSPPQTLREAANSCGVLSGTAVRPSLLLEAAYSATLSREFNMVEPEDAMKWWELRPGTGTFEFKKAIKSSLMRRHGMKVRGHCLVWDHSNPKWLDNGHFAPVQMSHLLQEHITTVMKHYAGQVFAWDVVDQARDEQGKLKDSPRYNRPGIGLADKGTASIAQSFRWAHEADPHALLFYNGNGGEGLGRKSDAIYAMVRDFKMRFPSKAWDCRCTSPSSITTSTR